MCSRLQGQETIVEYIWLAKDQSIRSKSRTLYLNIGDQLLRRNILDHIPEWNYDGSSTDQASSESSEVILRPVAIFNDPFRKKGHKLVLCDGYSPTNTNIEGYNRREALSIFDSRKHEDIWFGIEQEYILFESDGKTPYGWPKEGYPEKQGPYYCGVGHKKVKGRDIMEEHYEKCLEAGIRISGTNAEVMLGQWEYQIGPSDGISAGDELWVSRYILERICEKNDIVVSWHPKPIEGDWNGSGCHTNFSTKSMRENSNIDIYMKAIKDLENNHTEHILSYGKDNQKRLTGTHETASIDKFNYGVGDRGASIRIPSDVHRKNYVSGYLEDRRPASNMDPYVVTSLIAKTIIPI